MPDGSLQKSSIWLDRVKRLKAVQKELHKLRTECKGIPEAQDDIDVAYGFIGTGVDFIRWELRRRVKRFMPKRR